MADPDTFGGAIGVVTDRHAVAGVPMGRLAPAQVPAVALMGAPLIVAVGVANPELLATVDGDRMIGGIGTHVEIDETLHGGVKKGTHNRGSHAKTVIVGALEREIQIEADIFKMQAAKVTFSDIERAVAGENITISGGTINTNGTKNTVRLKGQFQTVNQLREIIVHSSSGAYIRLSDLAEVKDDFKEQESFARLDGNNVITLNVIKKSGTNLWMPPIISRISLIMNLQTKSSLLI